MNKLVSPSVPAWTTRAHAVLPAGEFGNLDPSIFIRERHGTGAVLSDGIEIAVDFVIVGMGMAPLTLIAEEAGLEIDNVILFERVADTATDVKSLRSEARMARHSSHVESKGG